jgi:hypothetical protein
MRWTLSFLIALGAMSFFAVGALAQNIISNPGFESVPGPTNDWQFSPFALRDGTNPNSGLFEANLLQATPGGNTNVLQQTPFGSVTPGVQYNLSYEIEYDGVGGGLAQVQTEFMNSVGGVIGAPTFVNYFNTSPNFGIPAGYQLETANFTAPANASAFFFLVGAVTGANQGDTSHVYVDDVSVTAVPEPASLGLLAAAGALMLLAYRRDFAKA